MKRSLWFIPYLLVGAWMLLGAPSSAYAQIGGMTCIDCHGDPASGGFHGGFRSLGGLTDTEMEVMCISCHDGSYVTPEGVLVPEAAVHQNKNPGAGRDEYGDFKATCLDCHTTHNGLLVGDLTAGNITISPSPNPATDEEHLIDPTTTSFLLDEALVDEATIVITDDTGAPFTLGVDYTVALLGGDARIINLVDGGAIKGTTSTVFAAYQFYSNQKLLGVEVKEVSSTDGLARIRQPFIVDPNNNDNSGGRNPFTDNYQSGNYASSGIPDDPNALPDHVRELIFHENISSAGTDWVSQTPPFNGACNSCHTRTSHHRRNNLSDFGGGDDHTHNATKNCSQCHTHSTGWVNKGG